MDVFGLPTLDIERTLEPITCDKMTAPSTNMPREWGDISQEIGVFQKLLEGLLGTFPPLKRTSKPNKVAHPGNPSTW